MGICVLLFGQLSIDVDVDLAFKIYCSRARVEDDHSDFCEVGKRLCF